MNKLDQSVDQHLKAIGASCPRLLFALQESPEAVWGEIMRMESACQAFEKACAGFHHEAADVFEVTVLVGALRAQMCQDGLMDYEEFAAFRQGVAAIQSCVDRLRNSFGRKSPRSNSARSDRHLKTYVFYCSNHLDAGRLAGLGEELGGETVKTIGLPCSGKVDVPYLVKALETGADGVAIVACKKSECRHFEGSARAHKRAEAVEALLEEIGFGKGRMTVVECAKDGAGQACEEIKRFIEQVKNLPPAGVPNAAVKQQECVVA
ncbi:MAG: hydrogenase iron-sulfur subunit [Verrucomicrobia bacterium]|nr:hydrogenase iron-sulfur subunit [Verrucomicrobiota bacterium]